MEFFDIEDVKKSLNDAQHKELQPFELAIARLVRDFGGVNLDDLSIIGIHRACNICDEILKKQFDEKGLR